MGWGTLISGVAALIGAVVGFWDGDASSNRPSDPFQTNAPIEEPTTPQKPRPSFPKPIDVPSHGEPPPSPEPISTNGTEITLDLAKLYEDWNRNALQVKDIYNGVRANISGFALTDSIHECQIYSGRTRCINFYPIPRYSYSSVQTLAFDPENIEQAVEINRSLSRIGRPLTMTIQGTISFDEQSNYFKIVDWQIVDYKPYKD